VLNRCGAITALGHDNVVLSLFLLVCFLTLPFGGVVAGVAGLRFWLFILFAELLARDFLLFIFELDSNMADDDSLYFRVGFAILF
jgi:hypothetical protein